MTDEGDEIRPRRFESSKLVRDRIPEIMRDRAIVEVRQLSLPEFAKALRVKLIEEAQETREANSKEAMNIALADVLAVVRELAAVERISMLELEATREKRAVEMGGFRQRFYLSQSTYPDNEVDAHGAGDSSET